MGGAQAPVPPAPLPPAWRWAGPPLAAGFAAGLTLRRICYALGLKQPRRAPMPVVSVGNLTVGGTGKTPLVAWLARGLLERGRKPAILMRGYGAARPGELNDEARELARLLPQAPVFAHPDRYASALKAHAQGCDVALLDDGFQHWRLARDLDVVLLDATDPLGGGHLLPWGRLREGPAALARAGAVVCTRANLVAPERVAEAQRIATQAAPHAVWAACEHRPARLRRLFGANETQAAEALAGKRVLAACGLGHPEAFYATLERLGAQLAGKLTYPDHFDYARAGWAELAEAAKRHTAEAVVVTGKDAAKLEALEPPGTKLPPLWALEIEARFLEGEGALWARIDEALARPAAT